MSRCPLAFNEPVVELLYYVGPINELCNQGENPKQNNHCHASRAQPKPTRAAKVGLGFTIPPERVEPLLDKPGQVHADEELARVPA